MKKYTNERNIQMLIYMLKENNIKKVIVNPGTMNMSFVISIQNDDFFEVYSCVDERSACYMACGMSVESNEPVVLTCTGATASRNYMPGLTEAFYRKIPIIAVTCTPHLANIGNNIPQMIDRRNELNDTYKYSTYIRSIKCSEDEWLNNIELNKAFLKLVSSDCGPIHINLGTEVTKVFDVEKLPKFRVIKKYTISDELPVIGDYHNIGVFIGNHNIINKELEESIEKFCEKYNSVVICDHTSNYHGKYKILLNLLSDQEEYESKNCNFDLVIHIGNTSGAYIPLRTNEVWRVNPDGEIRDTFKKITKVFMMEEYVFFKNISSNQSAPINTTHYDNIKKEINELNQLVSKVDLPFSNLYITRKIISKIPNKSNIHLAILNSLRSWNYFNTSLELNVYCNTGGFGIDGMLSTLIGASLCNPHKMYYGVVGDLAFFYDLNSLGNRHINKNLKILLINNGCGTEFHNYSHPANIIGQENISNYIAGDGHFGNKSSGLVKNYVESLGFDYISASNKEEFEKNYELFCDNNITDKPLVFEVFTSSDDESKALSIVRNLKSTLKEKIKHKVKKTLSPEIKNKIKKAMKV